MNWNPAWTPQKETLSYGSYNLAPAMDWGKIAPPQLGGSPQIGNGILSQNDWLARVMGSTDLNALAPELRAQLGMGYSMYENQAQQNLDSNALARETLAASQLSPFQKGAQTFGTIAQGIGSLYGIYAGLQGMKEQKRNNAFQRGVVNTNLNNSISDYNRRLTDTLTNRSLNNGQGQGWVSSQLDKYQAKRYD